MLNQGGLHYYEIRSSRNITCRLCCNRNIINIRSEAEIEVFESAEAPSFLSCGIQSYLEDVAPSLQSLHYADAESLKEQGVNLHLQTTVTDLDTQNKTVTIKKMATLQKSLTINYS